MEVFFAFPVPVSDASLHSEQYRRSSHSAFLQPRQVPIHQTAGDDGLMEEKDPETPPRMEGEDSTTAEESEKRLAHYLRMLSDDNNANRWKAADSLGRLKDPRGTDPLIDALFDEDARVRVKVAWALGSIGDPRALAPLRQLYRIERQDQQEIIGEAIESIKRTMSGE